MKKETKIKAGIGGAAALVAAALVVSQMAGGRGTEAPAMADQGANVSVVRAAVPETGDIELTTGLTGTVEPSDVVYVYAKAAGDVTAVNVSAGDTVEQGQLLCVIDTEQVETAKNSMDSAQEYEQYENQLRSAELQYESAKLAYDKQVSYSQITAPISGRVESIDLEVHDHVSQSDQICVITGEGGKKVSFYVTERMMENIQTGDTLTIQKDGSAYEAVISEIATMVDDSTGLFKVKAELSDAEGVATGSTVKLELVTSHTEDAMVVPVDAVYYSGGDAFVYVYEEGTVHMVQVEIGLYDSDYAEILRGLEPEDMVVSTWSSNLYEGATVQLREETAEPETEAETPAGSEAE